MPTFFVAMPFIAMTVMGTLRPTLPARAPTAPQHKPHGLLPIAAHDIIRTPSHLCPLDA
ncbi:bsr7449 [Bradyrhizobium diazoefficiens USDA 110]|uniref:Bsr7449 protein n=1 Tax=Bradyrhizobium diazoefficiens (strain JCM 10833 / BCRC 13528 / IAM 13628 / NBRC 14792 / USDA 110) TaxID=224911 RepID=Q89DJ0_BRADU|nr:hypothetical protein Bdiaspc4_39305 [Bradyrhizobium diazoefficiens]BAC52714.1 bsr7449 [Bradyrhizobium diazoefficiens USDA 110]